MEKTIRKYGKVYRKALSFRHCRDIEAKAAAYESRLRKMYSLTPAGAEQIRSFLGSWQEIRKMYDFIREETP